MTQLITFCPSIICFYEYEIEPLDYDYYSGVKDWQNYNYVSFNVAVF